jgi:hypothetical protein
MSNQRIQHVRLLALVGVLLGGAVAVGCGGGGVDRTASTVVDLRPPLVPPPVIPIPPVVPPAPVDPPPVDPPPPPPLPPAPDFAHVRSMATVALNLDVTQAPAEYVGLYVGDEEGGLWRRDTAGDWTKFLTLGFTKIEALTYVASRHALYMILDGNRLARLGLEPAEAVLDMATEPATVLDPGGLRVEVLATANPDDVDMLDYANVTGLAFEPVAGLLYGMARDHQILFHFADLDSADQVSDREFNINGAFMLLQVEDLAIDAVSGRLLALDGGRVAEIDLATFDVVNTVDLGLTDARALAGLDDGSRIVVDRSIAAILHFSADGVLVE